MADLDSLRPDQRAVVQLLVGQGKSYEEIADLLGIDADVVRRRAHEALAALAPEGGPQLEPSRRAQVADYLLGQQTADQQEATRDRLAQSPEARAWARAVGDSLRSVSPAAIPEIPAQRAPRAAAPSDEGPAPYTVPPEAGPHASRLGGALLLAGAGVVAAVVVILLVGGGGGDHKGATSTVATSPTTQTTSTQAQGTPQPVAQINLLPPGGGSRPVGIAQVFRVGQQEMIILGAQGVTPGAYALWLYNSGADARFLGFVAAPVGRRGRFATRGPLPGDAGRYRLLVVSREQVSRNTRRTPTRPGQIVLQGRLNLG
ncbi:MAG: sigma factor-like helix-turn-helix DNA-binding protein [Solirubrobacteraceae bacterium]|jgi:hypothetical protein